MASTVLRRRCLSVILPLSRSASWLRNRSQFARVGAGHRECFPYPARPPFGFTRAGGGQRVTLFDPFVRRVFPLLPVLSTIIRWCAGRVKAGLAPSFSHFLSRVSLWCLQLPRLSVGVPVRSRIFGQYFAFFRGGATWHALSLRIHIKNFSRISVAMERFFMGLFTNRPKHFHAYSPENSGAPMKSGALCAKLPNLRYAKPMPPSSSAACRRDLTGHRPLPPCP